MVGTCAASRAWRVGGHCCESAEGVPTPLGNAGAEVLGGIDIQMNAELIPSATIACAAGSGSTSARTLPSAYPAVIAAWISACSRKVYRFRVGQTRRAGRDPGANSVYLSTRERRDRAAARIRTICARQQGTQASDTRGIDLDPSRQPGPGIGTTFRSADVLPFRWDVLACWVFGPVGEEPGLM